MDRQILNKGAGLLAVLFVAANMNLVFPVAAEARNIKNTTRTSVNRNVNVSQRNVNVNRNVDIDVDVDRPHTPARMLSGSRQWLHLPAVRRHLVSAAVRRIVGDLCRGKSATVMDSTRSR
jgi:hypothetical protein